MCTAPWFYFLVSVQVLIWHVPSVYHNFPFSLLAYLFTLIQYTYLNTHCVSGKVPGEVKLLSSVQLFVTPWGVAYQTPSMRFSRQEYGSGLPFHSPKDLSDPGIEPGSPTLQADALPSEPPLGPKDIMVNDVVWKDSLTQPFYKICWNLPLNISKMEKHINNFKYRFTH